MGSLRRQGGGHETAVDRRLFYRRLLRRDMLSRLSEFRELFAYNAWANRLMFDAADALPAELYQRGLKSSHGGIHGTLAHIVWAEHLWLHRWLMRPNPAVAQGRDLATIGVVRARWEEIEAERGRFLAGL